MMIVNAKALAEARKKKNWTQVDLSNATKPQINVSTISRFERGQSGKAHMQTVRGLATALGVTVESLCSAEQPDRDVVKLSLDASARNALTLVSQRYGIRRERIVALAPLLFFIAAEKSLRERQERVDQLIGAADDLVDLQKQIRHLPLHAPLDDNAVGSEQDSITARDLFAERVLDEPDLFTSLDRSFEEASDNPFVAHLKRALESVGASDDEVSSVWWHPHSWPKYEICSDQAEQIVGSNAGAVNAILLGAAALHEMPKAAREERAAWAIGEYRRKFGDLDDSIEDLLSQASGDKAKDDGGSSSEASS